MPAKTPAKVPLKVLVQADLVKEMDEAIRENAFDGRTDLILYLIRNYLAEQKQLKKIDQEYQIYIKPKK